ncbi:hypothetical protein [Olsenella uli]|uniref:hypothetical protein n=1 Tax=Olsenella uli TaxID=133926 RepID=UPI000447E20F|nr:hypothetical protein [Olsenella uli]EUB32447.1 hypothetical protein HMPREF1503_1179 [Olsenella uli MSTE5]
MANKGNLVPNESRTPSQRRENARKAGKASGRSRREKRDMRETFRAMLDMPLRPGGTTQAQTMDGMDGKNMTVGQAIALAQLRKAMAGDTRAAEFVRDTSGQRPSDRVELTAPSRESAEEFGRMLDEAMRDGG